MTARITSVLFILFSLLTSCAQHSPDRSNGVTDNPVQHDYTRLHRQIDSLAKSIKGNIGLAFVNLNTGDSFSFHGNDSFSMFSTYKLPLVLFVLHQIEVGKLGLQDSVTIPKSAFARYRQGTFFNNHPPKDTRLPIDSLIWYAMAFSDNITTDQLFELVGGPDSVHQYVRSKGIEDMHIRHTVWEMGTKNLYHENWCSPLAMTRLLRLFEEGKFVNKQHKDYLMHYMRLAPSGSKRMKLHLPETAEVAHKTGTGPTGADFTDGANDVGFFKLPNGEMVAISIYTGNMATDLEGCESVIAQLAKMVYDDAMQQVNKNEAE